MIMICTYFDIMADTAGYGGKKYVNLAGNTRVWKYKTVFWYESDETSAFRKGE